MTRPLRTLLACTTLAYAMAALLACGGEEAGPTAAPASPASPESDAERAAACAARTARLEQTLAALEPGPIVPVPPRLDPPATSAGEELRHAAPTVTVRAGGALELDGRPLADPAALGTDLATLRRNWSLVEPSVGYPAVLHAWIDRDVTLASLRAYLAAASDHRIVVLAVERAPRPTVPPCPASLGGTCARLPRLAPRERPAELQLAWWSAAGECPSLRALSESVAGAASSARAQLVRDGLPDAVRACECDADVDALEYVAAVSLASPFDPPVRALELPPPAEADGITTVGAWASTLVAEPRDDAPTR